MLELFESLIEYAIEHNLKYAFLGLLRHKLKIVEEEYEEA